MLTKKLQFDGDVTRIIREMEWRNEGLFASLTCGQLDRTTYVKVNKALEAMGGKWTRGQGGFVFKTDPRPQVEGLIESGTLEVARDGFFETPLKIVQKMIALVRPTGSVLEPSAGLGAIVDNLPVAKDQIFCVEINKERCAALAKKGYRVECGDFLQFKPNAQFDTIFMNPPFEQSQDIDHVKYAYSLLRAGGGLVSVMSEHPFFADDKKSVEFRAWLREVSGRSEQLPEGSFKESGTGVNTRLIWINK